MALHSEARTVANSKENRMAAASNEHRMVPNSKEDGNLTLAELLQTTESGSGCDGSTQVLLSMEKARSLTIRNEIRAKDNVRLRDEPRNPATSNTASNAPVNVQQPAGGQESQKRPANGAPAGSQPSPKRRAGEEPSGQQPAVEGRGEDTGGEGSAREGSPDSQPSTNNTTRTALPTNAAATMSISERLDRGLITDVAGLNSQEQDELLLWARGKGMKFKDIVRKFKFKVKESTLRGRHRRLTKGRLPRKPEFTERDNELLLEAIEHIAGGHPDDVEKTNIRRLWSRAQEYIKKHGGKTEAGPWSLKKKYKELTENMPDIRKDLKPSKAKWNHEAYKNYSVQGQEEATFDDDAEEEPGGKPGTPNSDAGRKAPNKFEWNHSEYEEGASFGETEDEQEPDDEYEEPDDEEYEEYEEDEEDEDTDA
ncbi:hypothetical protein SLS63_005713 [Diaporthe eres]|uniref:Myb-like domain-containing protein n=1 Tax=Diaporthe eres TaxID=83184 RepID=A0ABR1PA15_DIAER